MNDAASDTPAAPAAANLTVLAIKESDPGEKRVAVVPETVTKLRSRQIEVLVERGAGAGSWFTDDAYAAAGAELVSREDGLRRAGVVLTVGAVAASQVPDLRDGQAVIGLLRPLVEPATVGLLAERGVTAISLDGLPRTVSRAQTMDALTSQANVAGYKAVLVAADAFGRFFPLLITAAGTAKPAEVLVLGAGVAGLQAMGTARRLGALVTGYDVRPETRDQVKSLGAKFLELEAVGSGEGEGGYARALSEAEQAAQQKQLNDHIARFDVVITTAQVPGRRPPVLVTDDAIKRMRPGSVVVDLGASSLGGNVEGSLPDQTVQIGNGVTVIGAGNLPSQVPGAASTAYANNVAALLADLVRDGALAVDLSDEVHAGVVITHQGRVVSQTVARLLGSDTSGGSK